MGQFDRHDSQADDLAASLGDATAELKSTLEREVAEILASAEARAARIEEQAAQRALEIAREAREASETRARESDHLQRALENVDRLAEAMGGMLDAMRRELGALDNGRTVQQPAAEAPPADVLDAEPPPHPGADAPRPDPSPGPAEAVAEPLPQPPEPPQPPQPHQTPQAEAPPAADPELDKTIRKQIKAMLDEGKSRAEAAEYLARFNMGKSYLGLIDEIYWSEDRDSAMSKRKGWRLRPRA